MEEEIPTCQKAAPYEKPNFPISVREIEVPKPDFDEILVKVLFSGVCHSDLHNWKGDFESHVPSPPLLVGGHEGSGLVVKLGSHVNNFKIGDKVGIKWTNATCSTCELCLKGFESSCINAIHTGFARNGTFQQYALVRAKDAIHIPDGIDLAEAAPILCAGITVYRGLKDANLIAGQSVAIVGCGGGLGSLAIQYAKAMGYRVFGIDAIEKREKCIELGVDCFVDTSKPDEIQQKIIELSNGGVNAVLNVAASAAAIEASFKYVRCRGTVILIAAPPAFIKLDLLSIIMLAVTIKVIMFGDRQDAVEALEFVARGQVKAPIEIYCLEDLNDIFDKMEKGQITGRAVIDLWK